MSKLAAPGKGCFQARYPKVKWERVGCKTPSGHPYAPKLPWPKSPPWSPYVVGGSYNDMTAEVSGLILSAEGSFDQVLNLTSETGNAKGAGPEVPNAYSLQINTNFFDTPLCGGAADPSVCKGWKQFVFSSLTDQGAFLSYWLTNYNTDCPSGWTSYPTAPSPSTDQHCYSNLGVVGYPLGFTAPLDITTLAIIMTLKGSADPSTGNDAVVFAAGPIMMMSTTPSPFGPTPWTDAEFNVFGDCCNDQANFNPNATLLVRTTVHYLDATGKPSEAAPRCVYASFTGETNNLWLSGATGVPLLKSPAIRFFETLVSGPPSPWCDMARGMGEPHLMTFDHLLYDFQASGDFVLSEMAPTVRGPGTVVHGRLTSGAPDYPNASLIRAVGMRSGGTSVAICLAPERIVVNGKTNQLSDGQTLSLTDMDVIRIGNAYWMRSRAGDTLRAEVHNGIAKTWFDVYPGLAESPASPHGLVTNHGNHVLQIESRDGVVFTAPFHFGELYGHYAASWRLTTQESLLSVCGNAGPGGPPQKTFYASDLSPEERDRAEKVCRAANITDPALLDACEIDVTVLGPEAAKAFVGMAPPAAVGKVH
jgi:hypothetical protein